MAGTIFRAAAAVMALAGVLAWPLTGPADAASNTSAKQSQGAKPKSAKPSQPLQGTIYYKRRRGGYSYRYSDVMNSRTATDPGLSRYHRSGPLDGDFFFERPRPPFGGNTPYMN
jgi:hypothetical protein